MASQTLSSSVNWIQFPGFPGLYYNVLEVDPDDRFVQLLMMFEPGVQCIPHRHIGPVQTLVLEGEHLIYEVDDLQSSQIGVPQAATQLTAATSPTSRGGDEGAVILLSMESKMVRSGRHTTTTFKSLGFRSQRTSGAAC